MKHFKRYFVAGLLVWLPIGLIYLIGHYFFTWMSPLLLTVPEAYRPEHWIGVQIPLIEWFFTFFVILMTGFFASNYIGRKLLQFWHQLLKNIPLIGTLFHAIHQFFDILFNHEKHQIGHIVLVEYPRKGLWRIGFQMSKPFDWAIPGRKTVMVLFPACPEPSSGALAITPIEQLIDLKMTLGEGLKTTFSFGILQPKRTSDTA